MLGVLTAMKLGPGVTRLLEEQVSDTPLMFIVGFLLVLIATMMLLRFIGRTLESLLESVNINIINRIFGGALTAAFMILIFSVLLKFAEASNVVAPQTVRTSVSYPFVREFPSAMRVFYEKAKPVVLTFWDESTHFLDRAEDMMETTESDPDFFDIEEEPVREEPAEDNGSGF